MKRIAAALAVVVAACSPLGISTEDRRTRLDAADRALADEILAKPLDIQLDIAPAELVFDAEGRAVLDARELEWAFQGEAKDPAEEAPMTRLMGIDFDALAEDAALVAAGDVMMFETDLTPLYSLSVGGRWTTTFDVTKPVTAALLLETVVDDSPVVEFLLDGERVGPMRDMWRPSERALKIELGVHFLAPGLHVFDVVFLEDVAAGFDLDTITFERRP